MANLFDKGGKVPSAAKSRDHYDLLHMYLGQVSSALRETMADAKAREAALVSLRERIRMEHRSNGLAADHYRNLERRIAEPLADARIALVRQEFPQLPQSLVANLGRLLSDWILEEHELDGFEKDLDSVGLPSDVKDALLPRLRTWVEQDHALTG